MFMHEAPKIVFSVHCMPFVHWFVLFLLVFVDLFYIKNPWNKINFFKKQHCMNLGLFYITSAVREKCTYTRFNLHFIQLLNTN